MLTLISFFIKDSLKWMLQCYYWFQRKMLYFKLSRLKKMTKIESPWKQKQAFKRHWCHYSFKRFVFKISIHSKCWMKYFCYLIKWKGFYSHCKCFCFSQCIPVWIFTFKWKFSVEKIIYHVYETHIAVDFLLAL